jgi:hypothetical protein
VLVSDRGQMSVAGLGRVGECLRCLTFSKIADSSQYLLRTSASVTLMVSKIDKTLFN